MKSRVLIVGATGFIGRHLSEYLTSMKELELILASRNSHKGMLKINDYNDIPHVDLVVHLGGSNNVSGDKQELLNSVACDIENSRKMLKRCGRAIYVSSAYVYKDDKANPISIVGAMETNVPYSRYKQRMESIFLESNRAIVVRPSNIYGNGMSEKTLVMNILDQAKVDNRIKINNCSPVRDFLHVQDFVEGLASLGKSYLEDGLRDRVFNFGTGIGTSVLELCEIINLISGYSYEIDCFSHDKHVPSYLVLEICRTSEEIHWKPLISLRAGLEAVIKANQR